MTSRFALLLLSGCVAAVAQGTASLSGTVFDSVSGRPLPGNLSLSPSGAKATSDHAGRFRFEELQAGTHRLSAERTGYATLPWNHAIPVNVTAGRVVSGLEVRLPLEGVITGSVRNARGEPVEASVSLTDAALMNAHVASSPTKGGTFRLTQLPPGTYHLTASVIPKGRRSAAQNVPYPEALVIQPGDMKSGITIVVHEQVTLLLSGRFRGKCASGLRCHVTAEDPRQRVSEVMASAALADDSTFSLPLPPGPWRLTVLQFGARQPPVAVGHLDLNLTDRDLSGVEVPVSPVHTVRARLLWPPGANISDAPTGTITLNPMERPGVRHSVKADDSGRIVFPEVGQDRYSIRPSELPKGAYLRSITAGGADITRAGLDLLSGSVTEVELHLATDGAVLTGQITGAQGKGVQGATVWLWPVSPFRPEQELRILSIATDAEGNFAEDAIAPGEYEVGVRLGNRSSPTQTVRLAAREQRKLDLRAP